MMEIAVRITCLRQHVVGFIGCSDGVKYLTCQWFTWWLVPFSARGTTLAFFKVGQRDTKWLIP